MRIELERLEELGGKFSRVYEIDELPLDDTELRLLEPAEVRGRIRREGEEVELRGELRTKLEAACSRCLKPVVLPINARFAERFVPSWFFPCGSSHLEWLAVDGFDNERREPVVVLFEGGQNLIDRTFIVKLDAAAHRVREHFLR